MGHIFLIDTSSKSYLPARILHYSHCLAAFLSLLFIEDSELVSFLDSKAEPLNISFFPNEPHSLVFNVS